MGPIPDFSHFFLFYESVAFERKILQPSAARFCGVICAISGTLPNPLIVLYESTARRAHDSIVVLRAPDHHGLADLNFDLSQSTFR